MMIVLPPAARPTSRIGPAVRFTERQRTVASSILWWTTLWLDRLDAKIQHARSAKST
jgi:hypothetical protein